MQPKNAHALNNAWKRQDTTQDLIVWFSGVMPNPAHAWTVRVADSKSYLGDYDATLQGNRFIIDTGQFADFPVGHYVLEIWETYSKDGKAETGIYPNPDSFVTFDINKNVVDDDLVKSFDIDEVLGKAAARANKAIVVDGTETLPAGSQAAVESRYDGERVHFTFKLPQGKTGQTGPTGPAPTLRVGSVTKVAPGGTPTASVTGGDGDYSINLGLPQGDQGTGFTPTRIPSGGDLNSLTTGGVYSSMGGTNFKNLPDGLYNKNAFTVMVYGDSNQGSQMIIDPITGVMYTRVARDNWKTWNAWAKIGGVPNLLLGTSDQWTNNTVKTGGIWDTGSTTINLSPGVYTYAVTVNNIDSSALVGIKVRNEKGNMLGIDHEGLLYINTTSRLSLTFTVTDKQNYYLYPTSFYTPAVAGASIRYKEETLVEWPTDQGWRPSPLDALAERLNKLEGGS